jgi:hypothetical protein
MIVCCECCVLSGRCLCRELITLPEESYRLWCVAVCDLETSWMRRPWPTGGCCPPPPKKIYIYRKEAAIRSIHNSYHTRKKSYVFRLHICSHNRTEYKLHSTLRTRQSSTLNNKYQVSDKHSSFSWWWAQSRPQHVEINKYTKNKLCTMFALFTR